MRDLDEGPHYKCAVCGELQPVARCIEYDDRHYCGLKCKLKAERKQNEDLNHRSNLLTFRKPGNGE